MAIKRYVVMDIGCLECGEPSELLGIYADKAEAEQVRGAAEARSGERTMIPQHVFAVFETEAEP